MNKVIYTFLIFFTFTTINAKATMIDSFVDQTLKNVEVIKPISNTDYNYESLENFKIKLKITENIYGKKNRIYDGQKLKFKVLEDVFYNNELILKRSDIVTGTIQTYTTRGMNGIPGMIIIDNFEIPGLDKNKLKGLYVKKGLDFTIYVLPLKWALTPLPPTGSLTNILLGGNAKITDKDKIIIEYYPYWQK